MPKEKRVVNNEIRELVSSIKAGVFPSNAMTTEAMANIALNEAIKYVNVRLIDSLIKSFQLLNYNITEAYDRISQKIGIEAQRDSDLQEKKIATRQLVFKYYYRSIASNMKKGLLPLQLLNSKDKYDACMYMAIDQAHVLFVAELVSHMKDEGYVLVHKNPFNLKPLIECIENPTLIVDSNYNMYDTNNVQDRTTISGRIGIIKSLLAVQSIPKINVDEGTIKTCFDYISYGEEQVEDFLEGENGFVFIEGSNVACISKEQLINSIYNFDSRVYNCLSPDNSADDADKSMTELGNQAIIKIAYDKGSWYMYLASLKNVYNFYKAAVIYLKPAWKLKWRVSYRNWRNPDDLFEDDTTSFLPINNYVSTAHCQNADIDMIYSLELCKDICILSDKFKSTSLNDFVEDFHKSTDELNAEVEKEYDLINEHTNEDVDSDENDSEGSGLDDNEDLIIVDEESGENLNRDEDVLDELYLNYIFRTEIADTSIPASESDLLHVYHFDNNTSSEFENLYQPLLSHIQSINKRDKKEAILKGIDNVLSDDYALINYTHISFEDINLAIQTTDIRDVIASKVDHVKNHLQTYLAFTIPLFSESVNLFMEFFFHDEPQYYILLDYANNKFKQDHNAVRLINVGFMLGICCDVDDNVRLQRLFDDVENVEEKINNFNHQNKDLFVTWLNIWKSKNIIYPIPRPMTLVELRLHMYTLYLLLKN
jgi:hypothetical protein